MWTWDFIKASGTECSTALMEQNSSMIYAPAPIGNFVSKLESLKTTRFGSFPFVTKLKPSGCTFSGTSESSSRLLDDFFR